VGRAAAGAVPCFEVAAIAAAAGTGVVEVDVVPGVVAGPEAGVALDAGGVGLAGATVPALMWMDGKRRACV
jgi:hypothetical protein